MGCYQIAGLTVCMEPRFAFTAERAKPYQIQSEHTDITVSCSCDDPYQEYADLAKSLYRQLIAFDGFLLHSSAVELAGKAYLFSAPSGTGKSTHTAHWQRLFGATFINDDKPAVRRMQDGFYACGTPFSGKRDLSSPRCVPIGGIAVLRRGEENRVRRLQGVEALWLLLDQILRPESKEGTERLLGLMEALLSEVPVYEITCTKDERAALVAKEAMAPIVQKESV